MCWAGHHRVPGVVAAVVCVTFVAGLPALTLWWLLRDPWVKTEADNFAAAAVVTRTSDADNMPSKTPSDKPDDALVGVDNPMTVTRGMRGNLLLPASGSVPVAPAPPSPSPDPLLGVFFYDYKPTAWHTKHVDLGLLLLLSLFRALLPRPAALGVLLAKTTVLCIALLGACVHVLWTRPYLEADAWMGWVRCNCS